MNPLLLMNALDMHPPSFLQSKSEKLKPRRERRKAAREAAKSAKRNEVQQAIAAQTTKINQRKNG
jgi:hypothetical protein